MFEIHEYFRNPTHKIRIHLIGAGGNGSYMLNHLARISYALEGMGRAGLYVQVFDPKQVTVANVARQGFSPSDTGLNKAIVLIDRINRYFGLNWTARPEFYVLDATRTTDYIANIVITCLDSGAERMRIMNDLKVTYEDIKERVETHRLYYWLDIGNTSTFGQAILGSLLKSSDPYYKNSVDLYGDLSEYDDDTEPSCSVLASVRSQNMFLNAIVTTITAQMLFDMLYHFHSKYNGFRFDYSEMKLTPFLTLKKKKDGQKQRNV